MATDSRDLTSYNRATCSFYCILCCKNIEVRIYVDFVYLFSDVIHEKRHRSKMYENLRMYIGYNELIRYRDPGFMQLCVKGRQRHPLYYSNWISISIAGVVGQHLSAYNPPDKTKQNYHHKYPKSRSRRPTLTSGRNPRFWASRGGQARRNLGAHWSGQKRLERGSKSAEHARTALFGPHALCWFGILHFARKVSEKNIIKQMSLWKYTLPSLTLVICRGWYQR